MQGDNFLSDIIKAVLDFINSQPDKIIVKYAKIDPAYTSGRPKVIFDGETTATIKQYPYIASYTPTANDRIMLIGNGTALVVVGKII